MDVGDRLADVEVRTVEGDAARLSRLVRRVTVIQLVRYYG